MDPYGKNLVWQWMGWRLYATPEHVRKQDVSDIREGDWVVAWQHLLYVPIALGMTFIPAAVAVYGWGELPRRALFAMAARVFLHQQFMALSQAAQTIRGRRNFSDFGRDSMMMALITSGEGYMSFHHKYPRDYRIGDRRFHYDPQKWIILLLSVVGLTYDLHAEPFKDVMIKRFEREQAELNAKKNKMYFGPEPSKLPIWAWDEVTRRIKVESAKLMVIDGLVLDVATWLSAHPGGAGILRTRLGKDCTADFCGGIYAHHKYARNLSKTFAVARIDGGCYVDPDVVSAFSTLDVQQDVDTDSEGDAPAPVSPRTKAKRKAVKPLVVPGKATSKKASRARKKALVSPRAKRK